MTLFWQDYALFFILIIVIKKDWIPKYLMMILDVSLHEERQGLY